MIELTVDSVDVGNKGYFLVGLAGPTPFVLEDVGIAPPSPREWSRRGFFCRYELTDKLILRWLHVLSDVSDVPTLGGVHAVDDGMWHVYKGLDVLVPFSGALLLGGPPDPWPRKAIAPAPWHFRVVLEAQCRNGVVTKIIDHSSKVAGVTANVMKILECDDYSIEALREFGWMPFGDFRQQPDAFTRRD